MSHLKELSLHLSIDDRSQFVDGTNLYNNILIHMPRLNTFVFYINTRTNIDNSLRRLSHDDIQQTFTKIGYKQVACIVDYKNCCKPLCHVFSLPFAFNSLERIGNHFPSMIFKNVTVLWVHDTVPFKHEFFLRIAQAFPFLKDFQVTNLAKLKSNDQSSSIIEYPHLTLLDIMYVHIDYVEQLLVETKCRLPNLTKLNISYDKLEIVTNNFTRDATRANCIQIKEIFIDETIEYPKEFFLYFPLL